MTKWTKIPGTFTMESSLVLLAEREERKKGRQENKTAGWLRDLGRHRWAETGRQAQASEPTE